MNNFKVMLQSRDLLGCSTPFGSVANKAQGATQAWPMNDATIQLLNQSRVSFPLHCPVDTSLKTSPTLNYGTLLPVRYDGVNLSLGHVYSQSTMHKKLLHPLYENLLSRPSLQSLGLLSDGKTSKQLQRAPGAKQVTYVQSSFVKGQAKGTTQKRGRSSDVKRESSGETSPKGKQGFKRLKTYTADQPSVSSSPFEIARQGAILYKKNLKKKTCSARGRRQDQTSKAKDRARKAEKPGGRTSKYRGVFWSTNAGAWVARLMFESKSRHLGYFDLEHEAALAYDREQLACRGSKVPFLNFSTSPDDVIEGKLEALSTRHVKPRAAKISCYRGVCWHRSNSSWKASILLKGKNVHIGYYDNEYEAAKAYDKMAHQAKGDAAKLNFAIQKP